jgi:hypothetical protein
MGVPVAVVIGFVSARSQAQFYADNIKGKSENACHIPSRFAGFNVPGSQPEMHSMLLTPLGSPLAPRTGACHHVEAHQPKQAATTTAIRMLVSFMPASLLVRGACHTLLVEQHHDDARAISIPI